MSDKNAFETLDPENWDEMRELGHQILDDAMDYLQSHRDRPAWQPIPPATVAELSKPAPQNERDAQSVYNDVRQHVMPYTMNTSHPAFWAWYMGSGNVVGALGDFIASVLNPNVGGGNHAAPMLERQVLAWIQEMMGFPADSSGLLTSGASMANFTALTVARNKACRFDVRRQGVQAAPGRLAVYASTEIHSCNQKAVETLGLGSAGMRLVPVNDDYTIDTDALAQQIHDDREAGWIPFCVIATSGTINTGAIDDMNTIADICEREKLWFHVDGAIGAVAILADNVKTQLAGIERADSVALDLHKWMHIPFEAGCVIIRDESAHRDSFALVPEYLAREDDGGGLASGDAWLSDYGLQLSRQFRALKIWMSVQQHGLQKFGRMMARNVDQAKYVQQQVENNPWLDLMAPAGLDIVCFRYNPGTQDTDQLNRLNRQILVRLHESGLAVPSYTTLQGQYCLRIAIANHRSRTEDFDAVLEAIVRLGDELKP